MALSIVTKSAEYLERMEKSGLLQKAEDERDTEPAALAQRRAWVTELGGIPTRRKKELPALTEAVEKARLADLETWRAAMKARDAYQAAVLRSTMAQSSLDGREAQLRLLLEGYQHPVIPNQPWDKDMPAILAYLHNVDDQVALMLETLRHSYRATHERTDNRDIWGRERLINIYNGDAITAARQTLNDIRDALRVSMHQADLNPLKQRQEADDLLHKAEQIVIPLFRGSPAEDIFRRESERLFGVKRSAA